MIRDRKYIVYKWSDTLLLADSQSEAFTAAEAAAFYSDNPELQFVATEGLRSFFNLQSADLHASNPRPRFYKTYGKYSLYSSDFLTFKSIIYSTVCFLNLLRLRLVPL